MSMYLVLKKHKVTIQRVDKNWTDFFAVNTEIFSGFESEQGNVWEGKTIDCQIKWTSCQK